MSDIKDFETALRCVIKELKAPKGQYNNFGKYKYRNAEDILEALKPLLYEYKLRLKTSDEVVQVGERYYVKSTVTVKGYGEEDSATGYAREAETKKGMDDSQITGSSSSYAKKYALNDMFDIDDTKDADSDDNRETKEFNPAKEAQETEITALAIQLGYDQKVIDAKIATIQSSDDAKNMIAKLKELVEKQKEEAPKEPF